MKFVNVSCIIFEIVRDFKTVILNSYFPFRMPIPFSEDRTKKILQHSQENTCVEVPF